MGGSMERTSQPGDGENKTSKRGREVNTSNDSNRKPKRTKHVFEYPKDSIDHLNGPAYNTRNRRKRLRGTDETPLDEDTRKKKQKTKEAEEKHQIDAFFKDEIASSYKKPLYYSIVRDSMKIFYQNKYDEQFSEFLNDLQSNHWKKATDKREEILAKIQRDIKSQIKEEKTVLETELRTAKDILLKKKTDDIEQIRKDPTSGRLYQLCKGLCQEGDKYLQGNEELQEYEITITGLKERSRALQSVLRIMKLWMPQTYEDIKTMYDTITSNENLEMMKKKSDSFTQRLNEVSSKMENDQQLKYSAQKSEELEKVLKPLKRFIEKKIRYFTLEDCSPEYKQELEKIYSSDQIQYGSSYFFDDGRIYMHNYDYQKDLATEEIDDLNNLERKCSDLEKDLQKLRLLLTVPETKKLLGHLPESPAVRLVGRLYNHLSWEDRQDFQNDNLIIHDLDRRSEAMEKLLEPTKLLVADGMLQICKNIQAMHDSIVSDMDLEVMKEQSESFSRKLNEISSKIEKEQQIKDLAQKSEDLEKVLKPLRRLIEEDVPYFIPEDFPKKATELSVKLQFTPHTRVEYENSQAFYDAAVAYSNKYKTAFKENQLLPRQIDAWNNLTNVIQDLDTAGKKLQDLNTLKDEVKEIFAQVKYQTMKETLSGKKRSEEIVFFSKLDNQVQEQCAAAKSLTVRNEVQADFSRMTRKRLSTVRDACPSIKHNLHQKIDLFNAYKDKKSIKDAFTNTDVELNSKVMDDYVQELKDRVKQIEEIAESCQNCIDEMKKADDIYYSKVKKPVDYTNLKDDTFLDRVKKPSVQGSRLSM